MKWLVCLVVFCSLAVRQGEPLNSGDACKTPLGADGICLSVKNCAYGQKILRKPNYSYFDDQYLNSIKCGDLEVPGRKRPTPMVCCPHFKNSPGCGVEDMYMNGRPIGRDEPYPGNHPWVALLIYNVDRNRTVPKCSGSLINERYVITAAHCTVDRPQWKLLFVRFNEFNTSSTEKCITNDYGEEICREDYEVKSITSHPLYDMNNISRPNDISLLRLATEVTFNEYVRPICLPLNVNTEKLLVLGKIFTVTGWGGTEIQRFSDVEKFKKLPGLDNDVCNMVYKEANVTLTDRQLCVGELNGSDSCQGDSGGPVMRHIEWPWYLFGVVSFGARGMPQVCTNVVKYLDWMEDVIHGGEYL